MAKEPLAKSLLLKDAAGKTKYFYPEKYVDKYNVELYEHTKAELAKGDTIRLTKTDKERERYANFEYKVEAITGNKEGATVILRSGDPENKQLILRPDDMRDAHWDYAQTVTGYGIQGGSKTYAIDFEASYRKNLANQRSFYISSSRAIQHLTIYTDNKEKLLNRILANKGDKYSALEVIGDITRTNSNKNSAQKESALYDSSLIDAKQNTDQASQYIHATNSVSIGNNSLHNIYNTKTVKDIKDIKGIES